jgi:UDP-N-acetylglucosamine--N-acetylmuramyl-(pentapeptide) pyrophosphoryl-undecaprenol N-acetylglucosamine transferase
MKVIVACGGTGGHAFPGLAVAEELASRGHDVTVWDSGRDIESSVMKRWKGATFSTGARQISARNAFAILRSVLRCRKEMRRVRPDVLLAMGSYSSLPPVMAARSCGVRTYLHEANTVPGKAVDLLSRFATAVAISFEMTSRFLKDAKTVHTGLPVRSDIASGTRFPFVPNDAFVVFVTGGSQGAHAVNMLMSDALVQVKKTLDARREAGDASVRQLYVIHQTGMKDEGLVMAAYAAAGLPSRVHAFENEMANAFATADLVVARAGASTCFELAACAKPSLLIPLPTALRDHQHHNAEAFAAKGAADEGIQAKLTPEAVCRYILDRYDHPEKLARMSERMRAMASPDSAARVADLVETGK